MTEASTRLKPIGWLASLLYFGIPCAVFSARILGVLPWMIRHGHSVLFTFMVTFGLPLLAMLVAAFVAYRLEGRAWLMPAKSRTTGAPSRGHCPLIVPTRFRSHSTRSFRDASCSS